ncbi:MAG: hypothetical protein B7X04_00835 [Parcubacteria group bacterium 21-54-25]|nr:MAG: hypothetical protein B7X04_00835 [Parcubacteria group bacterium 21-54-25]HQU07945.1 GatB/YqeY domain-containing protein [Candidatus Paceibacterota bacterium]
MTIHESIKAGIPEAMRAKDTVRLTTLRSLLTAITNEVVAKKRKPDELLADDETLVVLKRAANQRKDSIEQYEKGGRPELAVVEKAELAIVETFLPTQMARADIEKIARAKMLTLGVSSKTDAGRFMGALMGELKGRADGADVKAVVDKLLA